MEDLVHRSLKFLTFSTESTRQPRIQEKRLRFIHFSFFGGSFFNRQASVLVTLRRMPHPISSPADRANMVKGIPIRQNMIVMPCPSRVFGVRFANPEKNNTQ